MTCYTAYKMKNIEIIFTQPILTKKNGKTARYASRLGRAYLHLKPGAARSERSLHLEAQEQARGRGWKPTDAPCSVILTFAWNGRADLIGLAETILDALQNAIYTNDKQVRELSLEMKPKGARWTVTKPDGAGHASTAITCRAYVVAWE